MFEFYFVCLPPLPPNNSVANDLHVRFALEGLAPQHQMLVWMKFCIEPEEVSRDD